MKRVIVSGANGFIGSAVVRYLVSEQIHVVALHRAEHHNNIPISDLVTAVPFSIDNLSLIHI